MKLHKEFWPGLATSIIMVMTAPSASGESLTLRPDGQSIAQLTSNTGSQNWENVCEVTPDDKNAYNCMHDAPDKTDLYRLEPANLPSGATIEKVRVYLRGKTSSTDISAASFSPCVRTHESTYRGAGTASKYWATSFTDWTANPSTLQPWNEDEIDNLEAGAYCTAGFSQTTQVTQCYAVVYYTIAGPAPMPLTPGLHTAIWRPTKYDERCYGEISGFTSSTADELWENLDDAVTDDAGSYNYASTNDDAFNMFFMNGPDIPDMAGITNVRLYMRYRADWSSQGYFMPVVVPSRCDCDTTECQWQEEWERSGSWVTRYMDMSSCSYGEPWRKEILQHSSFGYYSSRDSGYAEVTQLFIEISFAVAPVVINEILYDYPGNDTGQEFIELYNNGDTPVDLSRFIIQATRQNSFENILTIPRGKIIGPHDYFLIGGTHVTDVRGELPDIIANITMQNGDGGGKLSDTDGVRLVKYDGTVWDTVLYDQPNNSFHGDNSGPGDTVELNPDVAEGHSLSRTVAGADTNRKEDFEDLYPPGPTSSASPDTDNDGLSNADEEAGGTDPLDPDSDDDGYVDGSETSAHTDPLNALSRPRVMVNEIFYDPEGADETLRREYVELYNPEPYPVDLGWCAVQYAGPSFAYGKVALPTGAVIPPQSCYLIGDINVESAFGVQADLVVSLRLQNGDQNDPAVPYCGNKSPTDGVRLVGFRGKILDTVLYDEPNTNKLPGDASNPAGSLEFCADVQPGHSLSRTTPGVDTNSKTDWEELTNPSPCNSTQPPPPTPTPTFSPTPTPTKTCTPTRTPRPTRTPSPTPTPSPPDTATPLPTGTPTETPSPTPTPTPSSEMVITEVMANPLEDGDDHDEYIELFDPTSHAVNVEGWRITDGDDTNDPIIAWNELSHGQILDPDCVFDTTTIPSEGYAVILDQDYDVGTQPYDFPPGTVILTTTDTTLGDGLQNSDPVTL